MFIIPQHKEPTNIYFLDNGRQRLSSQGWRQWAPSKSATIQKIKFVGAALPIVFSLRRVPRGERKKIDPENIY